MSKMFEIMIKLNSRLNTLTFSIMEGLKQISQADPHFVVYCLDNLLPQMMVMPYPENILALVSHVILTSFDILPIHGFSS